MIATLRTGMLLSAAVLAAQVAHPATPASVQRLEREVRRELITLPFYSLFDHFAFRVDGYTVTLTGKVTRPDLKRSAENVVRRIEGVEQVVNLIDVLPLSPNDDRLRLRLFRAIYGHSVLQPLSIRALPPVHILVDNGRVTLEGVVDSEMQKTIAGVQANTVPGILSVTNNVRVEAAGR